MLWSIPMHGSVSLVSPDNQPLGQFPLDDNPLDEKNDSKGWESELDDCETRLALDTRIVSLHLFSTMVARLSKASEPQAVPACSSSQFARGPPTLF